MSKGSDRYPTLTWRNVWGDCQRLCSRKSVAPWLSRWISSSPAQRPGVGSNEPVDLTIEQVAPSTHSFVPPPNSFPHLQRAGSGLHRVVGRLHRVGKGGYLLDAPQQQLDSALCLLVSSIAELVAAECLRRRSQRLHLRLTAEGRLGPPPSRRLFLGLRPRPPGTAGGPRGALRRFGVTQQIVEGGGVLQGAKDGNHDHRILKIQAVAKLLFVPLTNEDPTNGGD